CRLQTAIAMAVSSDILILDEPTAGLDRVTTNKLMARVIDDCNKKHRTLIVITHDEEVASMMDYVYSLD
ncbi:MAG: ABC transporter permease, partial [Selenomonadaceae bacterium]|nr:ABC transporter permease [Selenomonadaceae bacterium]